MSCSAEDYLIQWLCLHREAITCGSDAVSLTSTVARVKGHPSEGGRAAALAVFEILAVLRVDQPIVAEADTVVLPALEAQLGTHCGPHLVIHVQDEMLVVGWKVGEVSTLLIGFAL